MNWRKASLCAFCCALSIGLTLPARTTLFAADASSKDAEHWPMWRGPGADGFAPGADPPVEWSETKNVRWKVAIPGDGSSTPVVWGDKLFVLSAQATDRKTDSPPQPDPRAMTRPPDVYYQFHVWCINRHTGDVLWHDVACEVVPHEGIHPSHSYAAASPVTDGQRLYVSFGSRGIYCYDLDGKRLWERQLGKMNTRRGWGEGTSPALAGDTLLINWDHEDKSALYALNVTDGTTRWEIPRPEVTSWATPAVTDHTGVTQVIVPGTERIRSYNVADGSEIWTCGGQTVNCIPSPILYGDTVVCISGYRGAAGAAIPLDSMGDVTNSSSLRWQHNDATPYVPSAAVDGKRLFFTSGNTSILSCLDIETGKVLINKKRLPHVGDLYASPLVANGRLYIIDREGHGLVLKTSDEDVVPLATNSLDDPIDASPIALGKRLYLRGRSHLYCLEESTATAP